MVQLSHLILLSLCLLQASVYYVAGTPRKLYNPKLGHQQEEVQNIVAQMLGNSYQASFKYSAKYRPPTIDTEFPEPTLVEISLDELKVLEFDEVNQTIKIEANLLREFKDSRLIYEAPSDIKFIPVERYHMWNPEVRFLNADVQNKDIFSLAGATTEILVAPEGRVLIKKPVTMILKNNERPYAEVPFETQLISLVNDIDTVTFAWKKENPVALSDYKLLTGDSGRLFDIKTNVGTCQHKESYGFLGVREFSCIELQIQMVKPYKIPLNP